MYRHFYVRETDGAYVTIDTEDRVVVSPPDHVWVGLQRWKPTPKPGYVPYGVENPNNDVPF